MTIFIEDVQIERLARQMSKTEGKTAPEIIRESVLSLARLYQFIPLQQPHD